MIRIWLMVMSRTDSTMDDPKDIEQRRKRAVRTAIIMIVIVTAVYALFVGSAMVQ